MTTNTKYLLNNELNGVEIYFNGKPIKEILSNLKTEGFRWNGKKLCWYAKQSPNTIATAESMANGQEATTEEPQATPKATNTKVISLADRLNFIQGTTDKSQYHFHTVGSNYAGLSTKETAVEVRKHLKKQFPEVKFSVTSTFRNIRIEVKSSPYNYKTLEYNHELTRQDYINFEAEHNKEINGILEYCKLLLNSYNYDDSDIMTDYFNTHFYDSVSIDYDYIQTDQTEGIKQDIEEYRNHLLELEEAEEIAKEKEYQEYLKEQEEKEKQYQARKLEREKEIEYINSNVEVKEIEEQEQYFVIGSQFAHLNKNSTLEQYIEEVEKGDYSLQDVKITREIHFQDSKALEYYKNNLMTDFDFLTGTGGSYTDDNRVQTMTDYDNMTEEERNTVKWTTCTAGIFLDGELQFVVDTSGHSYARYVGLVENVIIKDDYKIVQILTDADAGELKEQAEIITDLSTNTITDNNISDIFKPESWDTYKVSLKERFKINGIIPTREIIQQITEDNADLKVAMYRILKETDKIQYQFKDADIQQGQQLTIFKASMLGGVSTTHVIANSVEYEDYAQYKDNVKLIFSQKGKKGLYSTELHEEVLIYDSWVNIPETLLHDISTQNGFTVTATKFGSYDKEQYNLIIDYLQDNNILPLINTIKPIF